MILIVDDRPENILPLKKMLELNAFRTDSATSGEEALKKILNQQYHLIILDVQMPGMDGFEVAEAISGFRKASDIPIIFLSAVNTEKKFITKGYGSGAIDYITKPVDFDILLLKVKTFYKLHEQQLALQEIGASLRKEVEVRKQAQDELAVRIQEMRSVLESLPQIAFTIGRDGHIEYVNEQWYHYSNDPYIFPEAHPDDRHVYRNWKNHFAQGKEFESEIRIKFLTTFEYRYFMLKILPVHQDGAIARWVGTFTDIHQQKLATEILEHKVQERTKELMNKNTELETSNHELQQFAWVVSHDLQEPLRKIQTFCSIIKEKFIPENDKASSYIDRTIASSERMAVQINDLLDYSRLSVAVLFQPTDLNKIVDDILVDFETIIEEKKAVINKTPLPVLDSVPSQMRQIFQNLIGNALKFSRKDVPPVISVTAERVSGKDTESPLAADGAYCRITVSDNGIGFDEKYLDRIFVIFQRLNDRSMYAGTGIGLAIAKKIVEKHEGIINAKSREGEGSTFVVVLPVHQENKKPNS